MHCLVVDILMMSTVRSSLPTLSVKGHLSGPAGEVHGTAAEARRRLQGRRTRLCPTTVGTF